MDRVQRIVALATLALAGVAVPRAWCSGEQSQPQAVPNAKVAARINGTPILQHEILAALLFDLDRGLILKLDRLLAKEQKALFDKTREQCIDRELLYQQALRSLRQGNPKGLKKLMEIRGAELEAKLCRMKQRNKLTDEQFLETVQQSGTTLDALRKMEQCRVFAEEFLRFRIRLVVERETAGPKLQQYWESHSSEFPMSFDEKTQRLVAQKVGEEVAEREGKRIKKDLRANATIEIYDD